MKKLIFAAMAAATVFASCSKNTDNAIPGNDPTAPQVQITLGSDDATRAFFDNTADAEAWEKEIRTLCIYVLDQSGHFIVKHTLTGAEIAAKTARLSLPNSAVGTTCSFYAAANVDYGDMVTHVGVNNMFEETVLDDYNGAFSAVTTGSKRAAGFVMTGKSTATIAAEGSSTIVGITLKRTVAKVAVKAVVSDEFAASYGAGTVVITSTQISRANARTYSYPYTGGSLAKTYLYSYTQESEILSGAYANQFFIYENPTAANNEGKVLLTLDGYYDMDGSGATTDDRLDVQYKIYLDGSGNGEIRRNGYYRIEAAINGLSGDGVTVNFTVADWETPVTQTVELGN